MTENETYNGWKNYETWCVNLWLSNDEGLYRMAEDFMRHYAGTDPYRDFAAGLLEITTKTGDGIAWDSPHLDHDELNAMMREFEEVTA